MHKAGNVSPDDAAASSGQVQCIRRSMSTLKKENRRVTVLAEYQSNCSLNTRCTASLMLAGVSMRRTSSS